MLHLAQEMSRPITGAIKGVPPLAANDGTSITAADVSRQSWRLLDEDLPFPTAVIRTSALRNNLAWMQRYAAEHGVLLAPHGKTTMAPQLFDLQLQHGAWGITVATAHQLQVCRSVGVQRIFMANQLIGQRDIEYVWGELIGDPEFEFYCLVDSIEGVKRLLQFSGLDPENPMNLLVEVGLPNSRSGCRDLGQAIEVIDTISKSKMLSLRGIECYEGLVVSESQGNDLHNINALFGLMKEVYDYCCMHRHFSSNRFTILSAGGSAYFDLAANALSRMANGDTRVLIRSGCYVTHDALFYQRMTRRFNERNTLECGLKPALEVWGQVQSKPEPGLAIVNVGKRDVSHDIELPAVQSHHRPGTSKAPAAVDASWRIRALNDQHAHLVVPAGADLTVGDLIAFGISHPCTTFDKWRLIWLVNDDYSVQSAFWTYF